MNSKAFHKIKARVLEASGGTTALADALGISSQAISQWDRIPAHRVGRVSQITGLAYAEIRPDIFKEQATA